MRWLGLVALVLLMMGCEPSVKSGVVLSKHRTPSRYIRKVYYPARNVLVVAGLNDHGDRSEANWNVRKAVYDATPIGAKVSYNEVRR